MNDLTNNVRVSAFYRLCEVLLQNELVQQRSNVSLVRVAGTNIYTSDSDRPWVFLNEGGRPESSVTVYDGVNDVTNYVKIHHLNQPEIVSGALSRPSVTYSGPPSGAAKASFSQFVVMPMVGYPVEKQLEQVVLPVAAVSVDLSEDDHFALGTALKFRRFTIHVDLLARNKVERDRVTDIIRCNMARIPILDWAQHQLLNGDGTVDSAFDYLTQFKNFARIPTPPRSFILNSETMTTEKERFRTQTSIRIEIVG